MSRAVFLDRDGTINVDNGYVHQTENLRFLPGAIDALRTLADSPWLTIVVTNQSGVGRGYFDESDVITFHEHMNERLEHHDATIDAFYFCPHHPEAAREPYRLECECRKPKPGLLKQASTEFDIEYNQSVLIGDSERDIRAGNAVGCQTILLRDGESRGQTSADSVQPDLLSAVETVVSET